MDEAMMATEPRPDCRDCGGSGIVEWILDPGLPFTCPCDCTLPPPREFSVRDPHRRYIVGATVKTMRYGGRTLLDVPIRFFREDGRVDDDPSRPDLVIEGESELLAEVEADALIAWLARYDEVVDLFKRRLDSLPENHMPYGAIPVGGNDGDFWEVSKSASYDLPFSVWAWADFFGARKPGASLEPDQVEALVDLARADDATAFGDLARALGVRSDEIPELWAGVRTRVGGGGDDERDQYLPMAVDAFVAAGVTLEVFIPAMQLGLFLGEAAAPAWACAGQIWDARRMQVELAEAKVPEPEWTVGRLLVALGADVRAVRRA